MLDVKARAPSKQRACLVSIVVEVLVNVTESVGVLCALCV